MLSTQTKYMSKKTNDHLLIFVVLWSPLYSLSYSLFSLSSFSQKVFKDIFSQLRQFILWIQRQFLFRTIRSLHWSHQCCSLIYFIQTRTCVNSCPNGFASQGSVCWPTSPTIANQYLQNPSIINPTDAEGFKNSLIWTILLSLGLGFIWIIFVQFFPKLAPYAAIVLAAISLITLGIFALIGQSRYFLKIFSFLTNSKLLTLVVAIFAFVLAALLIGMGCYYSNQLRLQGIFLEYSRRFLH